LKEEMDVSTLFASIALAFVVGFAIQRGRVCCVAAAEQMVVNRRPQRMKAYLLVACWSAVVILPLAWLFPGIAVLSVDYPIRPQVVVAPVFYGLGAWLNGACVFGTLAGLTRGELDYLATSGGIVVGAVAVASARIGHTLSDPAPVALQGAPDIIRLVLWGVALLLVAHAVQRHFRVRRRRRDLWRTLLKAGHWRPATAMAVLGIAGGLLYATAGKWTYLAVLSDRSAALVRMSEAGLQIAPLVLLLALGCGGVAAARLSGRFGWKAPSRKALVTRFSGGVLMCGGAAVLPGGNDTLLLYGLPSAVSYAFVGYAVMIVSLCVLIQTERWLRTRVGRRHGHGPHAPSS
jgi:hypothetical protein